MLNRRMVLLLAVLGVASTLAIATGGSASTGATRCTITGTKGNDVLRGTSKSEVICGLGGSDTIRGGGGNDTLLGGAGNDTLVGGNGLDLMVGGPGNDVFFAAGGRADRINGGTGRERAVVDSKDRVVAVEDVQRLASTRPLALPPLPAEVKSRGRWVVGVKCDAPPFGYIDVRGQNAGFDVEIARWFARYAFGREGRVNFVCAPTPAREPLITTGRVDLVISTFTYTADRDTRIDFSRAYYKATGRLLVKTDSPIRTLNDIRNRRVATTSGSIYDRWMRRCFASTDVTVADSFTNALLAFNQGRADALMWDDTVLVGVAAADRSAHLIPDTFLALPYGIGLRQGHTAMKRWVDSRLELMRRNDIFMSLLQNNVPARFVADFSRNILRPSNTFGYAPPGAPSADTVCP
jgi:polar amino acid transport system substrate-binding protein